MQTKLTILIAEDGQDYVAYCSELGIARRGRTASEAQESIEDAIRSALEGSGVSLRKQEELN